MATKPKLKLDWCTHKAAKYACEKWHYSKCHPSTMQKAFRIGVWEDNIFKGVLIFGMGANPQIGSPYGLKITEICELTRVAMDNKHRYPVSKYLSLAIKLFLKKQLKGIRMIVSYADSGQDHHGGIYQANNWVYVMKSKGVGRIIIYQGKEYHSKGFRTSHPGKKPDKILPGTDKFKYLYPLDEEMKKLCNKLSKPYPKRIEHESNAATFQVAEGGAVPTDSLHSNKNKADI